MTENVIKTKSYAFALRIVKLYKHISVEKREFVLSKQLLRSGTSIGANVREAQGCESKVDFIHKMKIAYKEAEETRYWLELCSKAEAYSNPGKLAEDIVSILKVLGKIISSSKN